MASSYHYHFAPHRGLEMHKLKQIRRYLRCGFDRCDLSNKSCFLGIEFDAEGRKNSSPRFSMPSITQQLKPQYWPQGNWNEPEFVRLSIVI